MRASSARRSRVMIYHRHEGARSCVGPVDFVAAPSRIEATVRTFPLTPRPELARDGAMPLPPFPGIPALLLLIAARLGWRPTVGELGALFAPDGAEHHLVMVRGDGPGTVAWALLPELPAGFGAVLMSESTAKVLRGGSLLTTGAILFDGAAYQLELAVEGATWTALAVAA